MQIYASASAYNCVCMYQIVDARQRHTRGAGGGGGGGPQRQRDRGGGPAGGPSGSRDHGGRVGAETEDGDCKRRRGGRNQLVSVATRGDESDSIEVLSDPLFEFESVLKKRKYRFICISKRYFIVTG